MTWRSGMNRNQIIKRYGSEPVEMTRSLLEFADLAGDIADKSLRIGIKPNLVTPTPASYGATTHPEIVEGIIIYLQEKGFKNITVLEGSWVGDKTSDAYEYCGYRDLCEKYDVPFVDTQKDGATPRDCAGMELNICNCVDSIDYMINVPVLKGHCQTKMTCALKNMKGLIPNSEKRKFHTMGLHKPIAHLSQGIHQDFIVIDHICGDPDFEEGGNPVKTDCVMVAKDPVMVDAYACAILGIKVSEVPYVSQAAALGSGLADLEKCDVTVINENMEVIKSFGANEPDPYESDFMTKEKVLEVSYAVDDVDACSACYGNFVTALYRLKEEGLWDPRKLPRMAIGQGHKGKTGEIGIGNCCREFESYIPGCPPREEDIYEYLKDRLQ